MRVRDSAWPVSSPVWSYSRCTINAKWDDNHSDNNHNNIVAIDVDDDDDNDKDHDDDREEMLYVIAAKF